MAAKIHEKSRELSHPVWSNVINLAFQVDVARYVSVLAYACARARAREIP